MVLSTSTGLSGGDEPAEHARGRGYFRCVLKPCQDRSPGHHTMVPVAGAPPPMRDAHRRAEPRFDRRGIPVPASAGRGIATERVSLRDFQSFRDYLGLQSGRGRDARHLSLCRRPRRAVIHSGWAFPSSHWSATPRRAQRAEPARAIGLDELVAETPERYLDIAGRSRGEPRSGSRRCAPACGARMSASPLMDIAPFTRHLEQAYRSMWRRWCEDAT